MVINDLSVYKFVHSIVLSDLHTIGRFQEAVCGIWSYSCFYCPLSCGSFFLYLPLCICYGFFTTNHELQYPGGINIVTSYKLLPSGSLQMVINDLSVYKFVHSIVLHSVDSCIAVGINVRALV
jgi:hypothetical protein